MEKGWRRSTCGSRDTEAPPTAATGSGPAYGDIIVEGSIGDASNLIPILSSDATSHQIGGLVYNGLVKYDRDLKIVGDLAESWKISPDGLDIVFHLRKGVKWHDGEPFTARDVLFTYQVTIDPKTPTAYAGDFLKVKKVTVLDDHTLRVCYDKPFAPAVRSWESPILPSHLLFGRDITTSPLSRRHVAALAAAACVPSRRWNHLLSSDPAAQIAVRLGRLRKAGPVSQATSQLDRLSFRPWSPY